MREDLERLNTEVSLVGLRPREAESRCAFVVSCHAGVVIIVVRGVPEQSVLGGGHSYSNNEHSMGGGAKKKSCIRAMGEAFALTVVNTWHSVNGCTVRAYALGYNWGFCQTIMELKNSTAWTNAEIFISFGCDSEHAWNECWVEETFWWLAAFFFDLNKRTFACCHPQI